MSSVQCEGEEEAYGTTHQGVPGNPLVGQGGGDSWHKVKSLPPCPERCSSVQKELYYSRHPHHLGKQGFSRNYIAPLKGKVSRCLSLHTGDSFVKPYGWNFFATSTHKKSVEARTYLGLPPTAPQPEHFVREDMGVRIVCTEGVLSVGMALPDRAQAWNPDDENPSVAPCPGITLWRRVCPAKPGSISTLVSLGPGDYITIPYHTWFFLEKHPDVDCNYTLVFIAMRTVGSHTLYTGKTPQERVLKYLAAECSVRARDYEKLAKDYKLYFTNEETP